MRNRKETAEQLFWRGWLRYTLRAVLQPRDRPPGARRAAVTASQGAMPRQYNMYSTHLSESWKQRIAKETKYNANVPTDSSDFRSDISSSLSAATRTSAASCVSRSAISSSTVASSVALTKVRHAHDHFVSSHDCNGCSSHQQHLLLWQWRHSHGHIITFVPHRSLSLRRS